VTSGTTTTRQNNFVARLDGRISESLNLFGRYSQFNSTVAGPVAFGRAEGPGFAPGNGFGGSSQSRDQNLAFGLDYTLSPTSV
jgi:hypothetical protein